MAMSRAWLVRIFILLMLGLPLAGCGEKAADKTANATRTAAAQRVSDQDVASGCWTAADRVQSSGQSGEGTVPHQQWNKPPEMQIDQSKTYTAKLQTNKGSFEIEFFPKDAPIAVNNFICLAKAGYYDNTPFHRIVAGFVIQGGDPTGTGRGGPGYQFQDEKVTKDYTKGAVAMANAGPNTNGSQFFVCLQNVNLPKNYTIFGQVSSGMDIVEKLGQTPTKLGSSGEKSAPTEPVTLEKVTITEK